MAAEDLDLDVAVKGFTSFINQMGKMDRSIGKTGGLWEGLGGIATGTVAVALGNIVVKAASAAANALASVAKATVGLIADSVDLATSFESQMSILTIAAKGSGLAFDELMDAARMVGRDIDLVGVSATGSADAMTGLYKSGLTTTEIFGDLQGYMAGTAKLGGALRASIDLAAATELDMVEASDLASIALATFGGEMETEAERAEFINKAMNNFVQVADASVAEVGDLSAALQSAGPVMAGYGFSLQDVNTSLGILSTRGITGVKAGTGLRSMFTHLTSDTKPVNKALKELNISLYDEQGVMRDLPEIIGNLSEALYGTGTATVEIGGRTRAQNEELQRLQKIYARTQVSLSDYEKGIKGAGMSEKSRATKLEGMRAQLVNLENEMGPLIDIHGEMTTVTKKLTDAQRDNYIQTLAGTFGQIAMRTLVEEGTPGWIAMTEAVGDAATIQEQAAAKAATYAGQMESLKGVIEDIQLSVGLAFLPTLNTLAGLFAEIAAEHGPAIQAAFESLAAVLEENLPVAIEFLSGLLGETLPGAIGVLTGYWEGTLLPAITAVWAFIQEDVIPVLAVLSEWLGQTLALAIQVLTGYWNSYLMPIFAALVEAWQNDVQPALAELWAWLQERVPPAIEFLAEVWETVLAPALANIGEFIAETLIPIMGKVAGWLIKNIPVAIDAAAKFFKTVLVPALKTVWAFIKENVIPIIIDVVAWLQENIPKAIETAATFWEETLQPALETVWAFIKEDVIPIIEEVVAWLQENIPKAIEEARRVWEEVLLPAIEAVWAFIEDPLLPLFEALSNFITAYLMKTLEALGLWWELFLPIILAVGNYIKDTFIGLFNQIQEAVEDLQPILTILGTYLETILVDAFNKAKLAIAEIVAGIKPFIELLNKAAASITAIPIPKWLKGRSPPPLALWFGDIGAAVAQLARVELPRLQVQLQAAMQPVSMSGLGGGRGGSTNVYDQRSYNYNLTTQATTRPGGLRLEFQAMSMASR